MFFPPPVGKWQLEPEPAPFTGILGKDEPYPVGVGITNPHLAERLRLAEKLRP